MIEFLLESLFVLIDFTLVGFLCFLFFDRRELVKKEYIFMTVVSFFIILMIGYLNCVLVNRLILLLTFVISSAVMLFSVHEENVVIIAGVSTLYISFINIIEFLFLLFAEYIFCLDGFVYENTVNLGTEKIIVVFISRLIALLVCGFIKKKIKLNMGIRFSCIIIILGLLSFLCMQYLLNIFIGEYNRNTQQVVLFAFGFMISFFASLLLVLHGRQKILDSTIEKEIFETRLLLSEERNASTLESYREIAKLSHDYKNHFQVISMLLKNKDVDDISDYIERVVGESPKAITDCTGIPAIDAVLSSKSDIARNNDIEFFYRVDPPIFAEINKTDICTVLLNLLDNAIEACTMMNDGEKRFIRVAASNANAMYFIKVENSYNVLHSAKDDNESIQKNKNSRRGYGLKIVEGIADRYSGCLTVSKQNNTFSAIVLLNS